MLLLLFDVVENLEPHLGHAFFSAGFAHHRDAPFRTPERSRAGAVERAAFVGADPSGAGVEHRIANRLKRRFRREHDKLALTSRGRSCRSVIDETDAVGHEDVES